MYRGIVYLLWACLILATLACGNSESGETDTASHEDVFIFNRVNEPNENAFSILVPEGWTTEGGIFRVDPTAAGGAAQSIAAKLDFAVKSDNTGTSMIRWLPDVLFYDAKNSPAGQMGMYPPGSNMNGMTVYPLMSADQFIVNLAFPYAHPQASDIEILETRSLPDLAGQYQQRVREAMPYLTFSYDAAVVSLRYVEDGTKYEETMTAVVENWGEIGAGMWGNKETFLYRTPIGKTSEFASIFSVIQSSVILNRQWIAGEIRGQIKRGEIALNTQREIQNLENAIVEHRQKTNAEIHNDAFLTLTDQEEYVNPFTNEVETGTNQWQNRWVNEQGQLIYTDREEYDPNTDPFLHAKGFKRTPVRPRFPDGN